MYRVLGVSAEQFVLTFGTARQSDPEVAKHTVNLSVGQLEDRYLCYLAQIKTHMPYVPAEGGDAMWSNLVAGFVIEQRGKRRLRCMFNATGPVTRTPRHKLGSFMVKEAIRLGARSLNCPADWREKMYKKHGFVETSRLVYMELPGTGEGEPDEG